MNTILKSFNKSINKGDYKSTLDRRPRFANVDQIQNYDKSKNFGIKNARKKPKKDEYELVNHEIPSIHKLAPEVFDHKVKTNYKQEDIFEMDKRKPKKIKEVRFYYTRDNQPLRKHM